MNFLFRLLLTFNSTSLIIVVYLIKSGHLLNKLHLKLAHLPHFISYIVYFIIPILLTLASLFFSRFLEIDSIESENNIQAIIEVEQANNAFLPSYLGYFFVALSVPFGETLIYVFSILFVFTFLSQTLYFNPLFLIFGYQFYYVTTCNNVKIFMITRRTLKLPATLNFPRLRRINNFTFIDVKNRT